MKDRLTPVTRYTCGCRIYGEGSVQACKKHRKHFDILHCYKFDRVVGYHAGDCRNYVRLREQGLDDGVKTP